MSPDRFLVPSEGRPEWFEYPSSFRRIVGQALVNFTPWHILEAEEAFARYQGLAKRYPDRKLFPFAYRQDNDDVACWSYGDSERVFVIHDFASPGWEDEAVFEDVWLWLRAAVEETAAWA